MKSRVLLSFLLSIAFLSHAQVQQKAPQEASATKTEQQQKQIIDQVATYLAPLQIAIVDEYLSQGACPSSVEFINDYSKEVLKNNPQLESVVMQEDCSIHAKFKDNSATPALSNHTLSLQMIANPGGTSAWSCIFTGENTNVLPEGCERIEED